MNRATPARPTVRVEAEVLGSRLELASWFVALNRDPSLGSQEDLVQARLALQFLVQSGSGLSVEDKRKLAGPVLIWLDRSGHVEETSDLATAVFLSPDQFALVNPPLRLTPWSGWLPLSPSERSGKADDASPPTTPEDEVVPLAPSLDVGMSWSSASDLLAAMQAWAPARRTVDASDRAAKDTTLLTTAIEHLWPIHPDFAVALFEDDEVWATPAMAAWARRLREPLSAPELGFASAPLINSRLAAIRPLLILKAPDALVTTSLQGTGMTEAVNDEARAALPRLLLGLRNQLDDLNTPGVRLTKARTQSLGANLDAMFDVLNLELFPAVDQLVAFRPAEQTMAGEALAGTPVRVIRQGVRERDTGKVFEKCLVAPLQETEGRVAARGENQGVSSE